MSVLRYDKALKSNELHPVSADDPLGQGLLLEAELSTDLNDFVQEAIEIANANPSIVCEINHDLDIHALKKKALREADRRYYEELNPSFEGMDDLAAPEICPLELEGGRPRMPAIIVFVLLLVRGWIGGPKSAQFQLVLNESITLHRFFEARQFQFLG